MTSSLPLPTRVDEDDFRLLIEAACRGPWPPDEVARLASHLAASGEQMDWSDGPETADVASTGGPGSLSTLLAPIWLRSVGCRIVKLAVPGRPAGAIDTLGTIPGYRVQLSTNEVRSVVAVCGFAHFLADNRFAPLDAALYHYRRQNSAVAIPTLAAASLLAKKVAVGVRMVGLDVRVGSHGNFGVSRTEARENAAVFCTAARLLGIHAVAYLGAEDRPAQPWIGRGESLVALAHALGIRRQDDQESWLNVHAKDCWRMAMTVSRGADTPSINFQDDPPAAALVTVREAFEAHLEAQGATMAGFLKRVEGVLNAAHTILRAEGTGTLHVDLACLRDALVAAQADIAPGRYRDAAGLRLLVKPGKAVIAGEPIAVVRCSSDLDVDALVTKVKAAFWTRPAGLRDVSCTPDVMEVVYA